MQKFKSYLREMSRKDLHPKYRGMTVTDLQKIVNDNRKYSPHERKDAKAEIDMRAQVREDVEELDEMKSLTPMERERHRRLNKKLKALNAKGNLSPSEREQHRRHSKNLSQLNKKIKESVNEEAPANNTTSGPGMGSDNTLHMKKMRTFKKIWRRHALPSVKEGVRGQIRPTAAAREYLRKQEADREKNTTHMVSHPHPTKPWERTSKKFKSRDEADKYYQQAKKKHGDDVSRSSSR